MAVHVVGRGGLLPGGDEALVVDGAYLVDAAQGSVGLYAAGIVVGVEDPLEVAADALVVRWRTIGYSGMGNGIGVGLFCQAGLGLEEGGEAFFAVLGIAMQVDGAPGTVFAIEQLLGLRELAVVVVGRAAVGAAPVLYDVPVGALAAVAGGDGALVATGGVEAADDVGALLGEVLGQHALVLQSPEDDGGRVAALLDPAHEQSLEGVAELGGVVPDVCRILAPEEHALLVEQLLIEQVVGLVGLAEGIEAGISDLLHAGADLLWGKGVALAQQVLILAGAVDEHGLSVEVEAVVIFQRRSAGYSCCAMYGP